MVSQSLFFFAQTSILLLIIVHQRQHTRGLNMKKNLTQLVQTRFPTLIKGAILGIGLLVASASAQGLSLSTSESLLVKAQAVLNQQIAQAQNGPAAKLRDMVPTLEADRLLLAELRKDFPEETADASAYIDQLRNLAVKSDPSRLGPISTRVGELAPAYLKWRDKNFDSQEAAAREYVTSGARDFRTVFSNFNNAVLQSVINHLDTLLDQLSALK